MEPFLYAPGRTHSHSRLHVYDSNEIADKIISAFYINENKEMGYEKFYKRFDWKNVVNDWIAVLTGKDS